MEKTTKAPFEEVMGTEEKMIWSYRPSLASYLVDYRELWYTTGLSILFFVTFLFAEMVTAARLVSWMFFPLFMMAVAMALIYLVAKRLVTHRHIGYGLSNQRVLIKSGFLSPTYQAIDVSSITEIAVDRGLLQHALGIGTIRISTARSAFDDLGLEAEVSKRLEGVPNPDGVLLKILRQRS